MSRAVPDSQGPLFVRLAAPVAEALSLSDIYRRPQSGSGYFGKDVVAGFLQEGRPNRMNIVGIISARRAGPSALWCRHWFAFVKSANISTS